MPEKSQKKLGTCQRTGDPMFYKEVAAYIVTAANSKNSLLFLRINLLSLYMKSTEQIIEENAVVWEENGQKAVVFECMDYARLVKFIDEIKLAAMKEGARRAADMIPELFERGKVFPEREIRKIAENWTEKDII